MTWFWPVFIVVGFVAVVVLFAIELHDEADRPHDRGQFGRWS